MTKDQFYENLANKKLSVSDKLDTCQHFLDNYPTLIDRTVNTPMGSVKIGGKTKSKLDIKINGGSDLKINEAFNGLVGNIEKLKKFDDGLLD